jgi:predicted nucleotidyltransferase
MMLKYKDQYLVSNKISVFNHYKRISGRSLEHDMQLMQKREHVLNDPASSEQDIEQVLEVDIIEILQYVYYAFRCAGEAKVLEPDAVIEELIINDITDGSLVELISKLMEVKKNQSMLPSKGKRRGR